MATKPKQKAFTFGTCALDHYGPAPLSANTRAINVVVGFEEALKLHFAIGEGLSALNKHNRAARAGRHVNRSCSVRAAFSHAPDAFPLMNSSSSANLYGIMLGEPGGTRTHGPKIKSLVLYQLSYGLARGL